MIFWGALLVAGALYLTRSWTLVPVAAQAAEAFLSARLQAEVELQGAAGGGFGIVTAERVEIVAHANSPSPLRRLHAEKVEIRFSPLGLLMGDRDWLRHAAAAQSDALVDVTRSFAERRSEDRRFDPATLPSAELSDLELEVVLGGGRAVRVGGARLALARAAQPLVQVEAAQAELALVPGERPWDGKLSAALELARDGLRIERAELIGPGGRAQLRDAELRRGPGGPQWRAELEASFPTLERLRGLLGAGWSGSLEGVAHARGEGNEIAAAVEAQGSELKAAGITLGSGRVAGDLRLDLQRPELVTAHLRLDAGPAVLPGPASRSIELERLEAELALEPDAVRISSLVATQPGNELRAASLDLPRSRDLETVLEGAHGEVALELGDLPRALGREPPGPLPKHRLTLAAMLSNNRVNLVAGALELPGGSVRVDVGSLRLLRPEAGAEIELDATVDLADLAPLGALIGIGEWKGSLAGRLAASGAIDHPVGTLSLSGSNVVAAGVPVGRFDAAVAFAGLALSIERLEARSGSDLVEARGAFNLDRLAFREAEVKLRVDSLARYLARFGTVAIDGAVEGSAKLSGSLRSLTGEISARAEGLWSPWITLEEASLTSRFDAGAWRDVQLLARGRLGEIAALGSLQTSAQGLEARVNALAFRRGNGELELEEPLAIQIGRSRVQLGGARLVGRSGSLAGSFHRDGDAWSLDVAAGDLALADLAPELALGRLDGEVALSRGPDVAGGFAGEVLARLEGFTIPLGAAGPTGTSAALTADLDVDATLAGDRLTVRRFDAATRGGARIALAGELPCAPLAPEPLPDGPLRIQLEASGLDVAEPRFDAAARPAWLPAEARGRAKLEVSGGWSALAGVVELELADVRWRAGDEPVALELSAALAPPAQDALASAGFDLELAIGAMGRARGSGTIHHDLDPRSLWSPDFGYSDGSGATVDAHVETKSADLSWVAARVPRLRRTAGSLTADLDVSGALRRPAWSGTLRVAGGEVKLDSEVPALSALEAELVLAEQVLSITSLEGELGGASVTVDGELSFAGEEPSLEVGFHGENLLLRRDRDALLRADADVTVSGPLASPAVTGTLKMRRSSITHRVRLLDLSWAAAAPRERGIPFFSLENPPFSRLRLDLVVESEEPIALRTNVAEGGLRPNLRVTGTGAVPRLSGEIYLDPTRLSLPGAGVQVHSGTLTFEPSDPFVPQIRLFGRAEKYGYDINVVATGPYDAPEIELTSTPPLSSEELLLILFAGRAPGSPGGSEGALQATQTVAVYLAQDAARAWLSDEGSFEEGGESLLDRFEVVFGREVSRDGSPTVEILLRLEEDAFVENDRVLLVTEQDVFEDENLGLRFAFTLR